ncbi:ABC transporter ATP-binding protein, partial [Microbispora rosea]
GADAVRVRAAQVADLVPALEAAGGAVERVEDGLLRVRGLDPEAVGRIALERRVALTEVAQERSGLHKVFLDLTEGR